MTDPTGKSQRSAPETLYIALGANLPSAAGPPRATLEAALAALAERGFRFCARSRWYRSGAQPPSGQPDFVNGVVAGEWDLPPGAALRELHAVERAFGRVRGERNAARTLDLDLIAYGDRQSPGGESEPILPHPRLAERAFVLLPLRDVAPGWRHPVSGEAIDALIAALPPGQRIEPVT